ncbi:TetR/AcrR family transcriptional regulator [Halopelagius fulvigenes]|uniref:TetR/AcrR family transcriptional regulator n=1 Tax=Halopelagius fulvigenes TaxID=1198324 RepID=A0ABD5TZS8_9EURY
MSDPFRSAAEDTHAEMMQATYDALRKHGYSELTIQRIGDEFPKSKSLIYQHYDGKDELLVAFLEFMLEHFESEFEAEPPHDARERLRETVDRLLPAAMSDEQDAFVRALTALRGQAPHDEAFRRRFTETDPVFVSHIADIVRKGVAEGTFRGADPERVAQFVVTTCQGAALRHSTTDGELDLATTRSELDEYLRVRLGTEILGE